MKTWIVLAMHGVPPKDLPSQGVAELMTLHMQLEHMPPGAAREAAEGRYRRLEDRVRSWPRTEANDPYHAASHRLAAALQAASGCPVIAGFNEFCAPDVGEALDRAVAEGARRVVVVTPMMTAGGDHAEIELPEAVAAARVRHPEVEFVYAWPFGIASVADFLARQVDRFVGSSAA